MISQDELYGIFRSLLMYYGVPMRARKLIRFYAQFIQPGDLCYDIGAHAEILKNLSQPIRCLSFEVIPPAVEIALGCIERLGNFGQFEFIYTLGESKPLRLQTWTCAEQMAVWLQQLPPDSPSGDIYARYIQRR